MNIRSINQVPCSLAEVIMTLNTHLHPLSLLSASLTGPTFCHFLVHPTSFWRKKVAWHLHILFMSDLVLSASRYTVLFDFFEIFSILHRNHISVAFTFLCNCFEMVQALPPYFGMVSTMSNNSCKSFLFYAINSVSSISSCLH